MQSSWLQLGREAGWGDPMLPLWQSAEAASGAREMGRTPDGWHLAASAEGPGLPGRVLGPEHVFLLAAITASLRPRRVTAFPEAASADCPRGSAWPTGDGGKEQRLLARRHAWGGGCLGPLAEAARCHPPEDPARLPGTARHGPASGGYSSSTSWTAGCPEKCTQWPVA